MRTILPSHLRFVALTGIDTPGERRRLVELEAAYRERAHREFEADAKARKLAAETVEANRQFRLSVASLMSLRDAARMSFC